MCGSPTIRAPHGLESHACPSRAIHVSLWQAGWLAGDICLSLCCSCAYAWGGHQGPPPFVILALSMQGPQSLHFVCVPPTLWFCLLCVCSLVLWPVCPSACVPVLVFVSLLHLCVHLGICLSIPLLVLCSQLSPRGRGDATAAPPINLYLTASLYSDSSEAGPTVTTHNPPGPHSHLLSLSVERFQWGLKTTSLLQLFQPWLSTQRSPCVSRARLRSRPHSKAPAGQDTFLLVGNWTRWGKGLDNKAVVGLV